MTNEARELRRIVRRLKVDDVALASLARVSVAELRSWLAGSAKAPPWFRVFLDVVERENLSGSIHFWY